MMCVHIVGIVAFSFYTPFNARKQDDAYGHAWGLKIRRLNRSRFQNPGRQGKSGAVTEGQKGAAPDWTNACMDKCLAVFG